MHHGEAANWIKQYIESYQDANGVVQYPGWEELLQDLSHIF